jgi:hypothetical protein
MRLKPLILSSAVSVLLLTPAGALATKPAPRSSHTQAKAYGKYCQGESKKHIKGQKGTPFSQCVTAMAKLDKGKADSARAACRGMSKKHVRGQKGTPYSQCISAAAKLAKDDAGGEGEAAGA